MRKKFLVFSDLHITPAAYDTRILYEISKVIEAHRPDYIVCTGDLGDFASQNKLVKDRGKYSVADELTVVMNYFEAYIVNPVRLIQKMQRRSKKKLYKPQIVVCLGNNDNYVKDSLKPMLQSLGVTVVDYRDFINLDGVLFSHTFDNGITGQPCTSTDQILRNTLQRSVSGHSHVRSITEQRDTLGFKYFAIKMPCATLASPEWAGQSCAKWDRGYLTMTIDTESDWFNYCFREVRS